MNHSAIIEQIATNKATYIALFSGLSNEEILWRSAAEKWSHLEILCHLYDEEREDFRQRLRLTLENPETPWPSIAPAEWPKLRNYQQQVFRDTLEKFLAERDHSILWLNGLDHPDWQNTHNNPTLGPMSAEKILANWLAHDYLHFRQITRLKHQYLQFLAGNISLSYAGDW